MSGITYERRSNHRVDSEQHLLYDRVVSYWWYEVRSSYLHKFTWVSQAMHTTSPQPCDLVHGQGRLRRNMLTIFNACVWGGSDNFANI